MIYYILIGLISFLFLFTLSPFIMRREYDVYLSNTNGRVITVKAFTMNGAIKKAYKITGYRYYRACLVPSKWEDIVSMFVHFL
jgi:hypothetical protein